MDLLIDWSNKTFFPLHSTYIYIQCKEAIHSCCTCAHDETLVINFHQMIFYFSFCLYFFFKHADCNHFLTEKTVHLFLRGGSEVLNADQSPHSPLQRICRPNVTVKSHKEVAKVKPMFKFKLLSWFHLWATKTVLQCQSIWVYSSIFGLHVNYLKVTVASP